MNNINENLKTKLEEQFNEIDIDTIIKLLEEIEKDEKSDDALKSSLLSRIKGTIEGE